MNFLKKESMDLAFDDVRDDIGGGEVITRDPFDPDFIRPLFEMFHVQIDKMVTQAQSVKVTTDEELEDATILTNQAKQLEMAIEKKRVEEKEPYFRVTAVLDSETKGLKDRLSKIKGYLDSLITPYLLKKEEARRESERKAAAEAARIQRDLDEKATRERKAAAEEARKKAEVEGLSKKQAAEAAKQAAAMVENAPVIVIDTPVETKVVTSAGSAKIEEEDSWEILDYRALPDGAFSELNPKPQGGKSEWPHPFIKRQLKAGIRNIPGVRVFKIQKLATRAAKRWASSAKEE